jgi:cytochrome b6-f complex iron-sulfur subunit
MEPPVNHAVTQSKRRDFLGLLLKGWAVLTVIPFGTVILKFVSPVKTKDLDRETIRVASVADIAPNTAKIIRFNKEPVIVVHTESGQFKAFSARCTHLGCVVQFKADEGAPHFSCNCHGSQFDITGKNIAGPAPRPLVPLKVNVQESDVLVTKIQIPT